MRVDRAREAALDVLAACRRNGAWIDGALKQVLKRDGLSGRDAAFASRIAYGVMQSRIYLDRCLARCLTQRPEKLEPLLLDILRIGAYQILFMDKVPVNAAVNEAVEMAKAHKLSRAAGLVNAVLRNVDRRRGEPLAFADELEALSVQTSHPRALVERVVGLLGAEEAEAFLRADNEPVPTTIQTNTLKTTAKRLRASLEDEGVTVEPHPWLADCFTVSGTGDLEGLRAWREGWFTVQDAAAKLTALAAAPKAGSFVIDTCAAPGGKSFAMAMCMEGKGHILSCDMEEHKLRLMEAGAERLGIECMEVRLADGRVCDEALAEKADIVVCDVPCSGLGIIRKKPDIRYKDMASLAGLPAIQRAILDNASRYVRRGGTLVYSTCTVLPEENERVTDAFLRAHPDFTYDAFALPGPIGTVRGTHHALAAAPRDGRLLHLPHDAQGMRMTMTDIKSMTQEEITDALRAMGEPAFRGKQVFSWLHKGATDFDGDEQSLQAPARKARQGVYHYSADRRPQAGFPARRHDQIPLGAARRQLHRDGAHELSPRQHRLHLLAGRLPDGLQILRLHHSRQGKRLNTVGDA